MENKRNVYKKRALRISLTVLFLLAAMIGASILSVHPDVLLEKTLHSFYNEENDSLDYVVLGASATQCGIYPAVIYRERSVTGNCLCVNGGDAKIYLSMLKELLSKQSSPLVIVDLDGFTEYQPVEEYPSSIFWMDSMKRNRNHFETVLRVDPDHALERFFPLIRYHKNLLEPDEWFWFSYYLCFKHETDPMKGAWYLDYDRLPPEEMQELRLLEAVTGGESEPLPQTSEELLIEFLEYCKAQKLKNVLFLDMPKAYTSEESREKILSIEKQSAYCQTIVERYGYSVFNYNLLENPASLSPSDFADRMHLNADGAIRFSAYFAEYLRTNYDFSPCGPEQADRWNEQTEQAYRDHALDRP